VHSIWTCLCQQCKVIYMINILKKCSCTQIPSWNQYMHLNHCNIYYSRILYDNLFPNWMDLIRF
jgi:hypothetical protein